jgi:hypothetical protein
MIPLDHPAVVNARRFLQLHGNKARRNINSYAFYDNEGKEYLHLNQVCYATVNRLLEPVNPVCFADATQKPPKFEEEARKWQEMCVSPKGPFKEFMQVAGIVVERDADNYILGYIVRNTHISTRAIINFAMFLRMSWEHPQWMKFWDLLVRKGVNKYDSVMISASFCPTDGTIQTVYDYYNPITHGPIDSSMQKLNWPKLRRGLKMDEFKDDPVLFLRGKFFQYSYRDGDDKLKVKNIWGGEKRIKLPPGIEPITNKPDPKGDDPYGWDTPRHLPKYSIDTLVQAYNTTWREELFKHKPKKEKNHA